ncbi:MAG: potassium channel protein [Rhodothermaceae bacterium]|nr:potassium channel protein [Rhodothermaceae bacterium]
MFVTPRRQLRDRSPQRREITYSTLFLTAWMGVGTVGYAVLEGWGPLDSLYMAFITLTTIGFTEVRELSNAGRVFTILFATIGIGFLALVAARWTTLLVAGTLIRNRRRMFRIKNMRNHYIICGYGRVGKDVTDLLLRAGKSLVVLDKNEKLIKHLSENGINALSGDATHDSALLSVGIKNASALITLLPDDAQNVYVTLVARENNPELFILARASDASSRRRILQAGASKVVSPVQVGAERMAQVVLRPHVDQFMSYVLQADDLGLSMEQVLIEEGAVLAGKTLKEAEFRRNWETIVIDIDKGDTDQDMHFYTGPDALIEVGNILIVLGSIEMIGKLIKEGCLPRKRTSDNILQKSP